MTDEPFPIGDPLGDSSYRCYQHLLGTQAQRLYLGRRTHGSPDRFLVTVVSGPAVDVPPLRRALDYRMGGIFDLEFLGYFDRLGANADRDRERADHLALVEKLPSDGDWLPALVADRAMGAQRAAALGASVGDILLRAAQGDVFLVGVRPEYIWARADGEQLIATGITARNYVLFARTGSELTIPAALFRRHYYAPEVYLDKPHGERALVFTLATMVAEWATGAYPFPTAWVGGSMHSLCEGRHAPLDLPSRLRELLERALSRDPDHRPPLAELVDDLGR